MNETEDLEHQMREALGVAAKRLKPSLEASNPMRGYLIILSARGDGSQHSGTSIDLAP
ncbi:hypothetical protein FQZ97_638750 [compost metagenome]